MIYLIDDKKKRQESYGWQQSRLKKYAHLILPIYNKAELDNKKIDIFKNESLILFHESFFDDPINRHQKETDTIRQDLMDYSEKRKKPIVIFGGSFGARSILNSVASLPVSVLYENLQHLLDNYSNKGSEDVLKYIVYGDKYMNEEVLRIKEQIWDSLYLKKGAFEKSTSLKKLVDKLFDLSGKSFEYKDSSAEYLKYQINSLLKDCV